MKDLTIEELEKAPFEIQYLYIMGISNQSVGITIFEEAIEKYPEYFPDEVEYRKKWALIPQEIHDAYWKEYWKLDKEIYKDIPPSKGLMYLINNTDEAKEWKKKWNSANKKAEPLKKKLHKKYYSKYGIKYNGI
jgi:hypothetical protein